MKNLKFVIYTLLLFMQFPLLAQFNDGDVVAFSSDTGKWLARCNNCQRATAANTATIHISGTADNLPAYAKFRVRKLSNGKVVFRADSGKFLARCRGCLSGGPADILTVHATDYNAAYVQFTPVNLPNGKVAFRSDNGNYLARCRNCSPGASTNDIVAIHESNNNQAYAQWIVVVIDE